MRGGLNGKTAGLHCGKRLGQRAKNSGKSVCRGGRVLFMRLAASTHLCESHEGVFLPNQRGAGGKGRKRRKLLATGPHHHSVTFFTVAVIAVCEKPQGDIDRDGDDFVAEK